MTAGRFPGIEDLIPEYIQNRLRDLKALDDALSGSDFDVMKRLGHQTKGHARSYGFPELETVAAELETAAQAQDKARCAKAVEQWRLWTCDVSKSQTVSP